MGRCNPIVGFWRSWPSRPECVVGSDRSLDISIDNSASRRKTYRDKTSKLGYWVLGHLLDLHVTVDRILLPTYVEDLRKFRSRLGVCACRRHGTRQLTKAPAVAERFSEGGVLH